MIQDLSVHNNPSMAKVNHLHRRAIIKKREIDSRPLVDQIAEDVKALFY